jgi:fluoride ion exporter CrcB/FEX
VFLGAGDIIDIDLGHFVLVLLATVGTALGAVARDALVRGARGGLGRADIGLAVAQVAACLVAGACAGLGEPAASFLVAGFAGGLSTWSALAVELVGWWRARRWGLIAFHGALVLALSMAAFLAGHALAGASA